MDAGHGGGSPGSSPPETLLDSTTVVGS
jgi:hypothetical protein